jgi:hypothetical protein
VLHSKHNIEGAASMPEGTRGTQVLCAETASCTSEAPHGVVTCVGTNVRAQLRPADFAS